MSLGPMESKAFRHLSGKEWCGLFLYRYLILGGVENLR
jgi:hypothetical protein